MSGKPPLDAALTVIIPARNAAGDLPRLLDALLPQLGPEDEAILVDDASTDGTPGLAQGRVRVIAFPQRRGPAAARNAGIAAARGGVLAFLDSDCRPFPGWTGQVRELFRAPEMQVAMGSVHVPPSTYLGDSISALGFPAGGRLGFEKMWKVDERGFTDHLSSCNFAARRSVFEKAGGFDEGFPLAACEDAEFSARLTRIGIPIRFCPDLRIEHPPRASLAAFVRWHWARGRMNRIFQQKVGPVANFIRLRIWSSLNALRASLFDLKFPVVFALLLLAFALQQAGYAYERYRSRPAPPHRSRSR